MLLCDHVVSLEGFQIMASSYSEFHLEVKESLFIARDKPELNRNEKSLPLYLFDKCILARILLFVPGLHVTTIVLLFHCNF